MNEGYQDLKPETALLQILREKPSDSMSIQGRFLWNTGINNSVFNNNAYHKKRYKYIESILKTFMLKT